MTNKQTSSRISSLAAKVLGGYEPTEAEIRSLAASALSQDEIKGSMIPNPIIPSEPMRNAVTKTSETANVQDTTLETEGRGQIASTDSATTGPEIHGKINAIGLKAATNKIRSACHRFAGVKLDPHIEGWLESSAYSVVRAYLDAIPAPAPQPEVAAEPVGMLNALKSADALIDDLIGAQYPNEIIAKLIDVIRSAIDKAEEAAEPARNADGELYRDLWKQSSSNVARVAKRANEYRTVAEQAYWLLAWSWQSHSLHAGKPFDMTAFAPEARDMMNSCEQNLFDALAALATPPVVEEAVKADQIAQLQLALVAWVNVAEMLADQPGMEAHFQDVADATLDVVDTARAALLAALNPPMGR